MQNQTLVRDAPVMPVAHDSIQVRDYGSGFPNLRLAFPDGATFYTLADMPLSDWPEWSFHRQWAVQTVIIPADSSVPVTELVFYSVDGGLSVDVLAYLENLDDYQVVMIDDESSFDPLSSVLPASLAQKLWPSDPGA